MSIKLVDNLSQDFTKLLNNKDYYDTIIEVEDDQNKKTFTAHSSVLFCRSPYFRTELSKIKDNIKNLSLTNISPEVFDVILKYIYSGIIILDDLSNAFIFNLTMLACEFGLEELFSPLEKHLIKDHSWLRTHFSTVYSQIFKSNHFEDLEKFYNDIIAKHPNIIFDNDNFASLQESALISLIKRDDLKLKEIQIWEKVIQWGIARNPTLHSKLEEWSNDDFLSLKTTLQNCLPHIRYFQLTGADLWEKVKPYKKILEKQLWDDLKQHWMLPDKPVKSNILSARSVLESELPPRVKSLYPLQLPNMIKCELERPSEAICY